MDAGQENRQETRILITGGSGFIGTNAVEYFIDRGYKVLNLDIKPPHKMSYRPFWSEVNILDAEKLRNAFTGFQPHYLLHLAARTDIYEKKSLQGYAANIDGMSNIIEAVRACPTLRRIIVASSRMVCRIGYQPQHDEDYCPPNLYGQSKIETERITRGANLECEWLLVRPTSIWGPWFHMPYKMYFETIKKRIYFNIAGHNPQKSFGFVLNTMYQLEKLLLAPAERVNRKTLYLTDYPPLRVNEWSEMIRKRMDLPPIRTIPYFIAKVGAVVGDMLLPVTKRYPLNSFRLDNLLTVMVHETSELEAICGELPYSLEEGVDLTVKWLVEQQKVQ